MTVWTGEALHGFKNRVARVQDMQVRGVPCDTIAATAEN